MSKSLDDFLKMPADITPYICFPLLPKEGMMVIAAPSKTYKSFLSMNIAYDLANGDPLLGLWAVKAASRVLLIEQEIGPFRLQERLLKLDKKRQGADAPRNLRITSKDLGCNLDTERGLATIELHIQDCMPQVVIFDPLQWFHSQDENDNSEMQKVVKQIMHLQSKYNFASIIIHHMGKEGEFRNGRGPESQRGASVLRADSDTNISIYRPNIRRQKEISLEMELRSAENPPPLDLIFDGVTGTFSVKKEL